MRNVATFLIAALLLTGCKNSETATGLTTTPAVAPLEGTRWTLVSLGDQPITPKGTERDAHLIFSPKDAPGRVVGSTGCNRLMGGFTQSGTNQLKLSRVATTQMACVDGAETETQFLAALERVDGYRVTATELWLNSGGTTVAKLQRQAAK